VLVKNVTWPLLDIRDMGLMLRKASLLLPSGLSTVSGVDTKSTPLPGTGDFISAVGSGSGEFSSSETSSSLPCFKKYFVN
jgi:hypothetical protein